MSWRSSRSTRTAPMSLAMRSAAHSYWSPVLADTSTRLAAHLRTSSPTVPRSPPTSPPAVNPAAAARAGRWDANVPSCRGRARPVSVSSPSTRTTHYERGQRHRQTDQEGCRHGHLTGPRPRRSTPACRQRCAACGRAGREVVRQSGIFDTERRCQLALHAVTSGLHDSRICHVAIDPPCAVRTSSKARATDLAVAVSSRPMARLLRRRHRSACHRRPGHRRSSTEPRPAEPDHLRYLSHRLRSISAHRYLRMAIRGSSRRAHYPPANQCDRNASTAVANSAAVYSSGTIPCSMTACSGRPKAAASAFSSGYA